MQATVYTGQPPRLNWSAKRKERIVQNVANLISTERYEVAYDRTMGLSADITDKPVDEAIAQATAEIVELVSSREPRATVKSVDYIGTNEDGALVLGVNIEL